MNLLHNGLLCPHQSQELKTDTLGLEQVKIGQNFTMTVAGFGELFCQLVTRSIERKKKERRHSLTEFGHHLRHWESDINKL